MVALLGRVIEEHGDREIWVEGYGTANPVTDVIIGRGSPHDPDRFTIFPFMHDVFISPEGDGLLLSAVHGREMTEYELTDD